MIDFSNGLQLFGIAWFSVIFAFYAFGKEHDQDVYTKLIMFPVFVFETIFFFLFNIAESLISFFSK